MMKRIYFAFLVIAILACNRQQRFEVIGTIDDANTEKVYLEKVIVSETEVIDSVKLRNGTFKLKGKTDASGFYQVRIDKKIISLVVEPGEKIFLEANYNELPTTYEVDGSDGSLLVQKLNASMENTRVKLDSIESLYVDLTDKYPDSPQLDSLAAQYENIIKEQKRHNTIFILNFYDNLASLYALYQKLDDQTYLFNKTRDIQYYKILADSLTKYHPESQQVKALRNNTKDLLANLNSQRAMKLVENAESGLPDLAMKNTLNDTIRLSDFKGQVVLLNFWASWSRESIAESIQLLDLYEKYNQKGFEIYQVSLDNSYDNWTRAIRFNELPWIHVSELSYPKSYAANIYNVKQLPTHYLINKHQDSIIGRNMTMAQLDKKLSEMLK